MKRKLTPAERLIVAADFEPGMVYPLSLEQNNCRMAIMERLLGLADSLRRTGVYIKVNSALRACGDNLIDEIRSRGLRVFADLKLIDIKNTLSIDAAFIREANPELLTVMCVAGVDAMRSLQAELPDTEVLGVTVLTSLGRADTEDMFTCSVDDAVMRFARLAKKAQIGGVICSPKELVILRESFGTDLSLNTPGIRPTWAIVPGDDQNPERIMTPAKAIKAGADRIVVGRPITLAANPYDAVMRTIDEIASATP